MEFNGQVILIRKCFSKAYVSRFMFEMCFAFLQSYQYGGAKWNISSSAQCWKKFSSNIFSRVFVNLVTVSGYTANQRTCINAHK